jgi:hypothetical protein
MLSIRGIVIVLLSCASGACAIHPLPENVTGVKTAQIVHRNRCEAQEALRHIEEWLTNRHNVAAVDTLKKIGVVMSYSLDMSEIDDLTASTTFTQALTNSTTTFNPNGSNTLTRDNTRAFTVADNYKTLRSMKQCGAEPVGPNFQYPIVGTIGIGETIRSFLTMALHEDLNNSSEDPKEPPTSESIAGAPTMVDTLTFTTTVSAGINPMIMLTPIGTATQLTNASLNFTLQRQDIHQVTIGLGLPTITAPEDNVHHFVPYSIASFGRINSARNRTPLLIDASVPEGTGPSSGVSIAMEAANNEIIRRELLRRTLVGLH